MSLFPEIDPILSLLALHLLTATALGIAVLIASRIIRHAPTRHALWLLVLLKLVTPPIIEVAVLPASTPLPPAMAMTQAPSLEGVIAFPGLSTPQAHSAARPLRQPQASQQVRSSVVLPLLVVLFALGSLTILSVVAVRIARFQRCVAAAVEAPALLYERLATIGKRLGLRRLPALRLVDVPMSPALCSTWRGPVVLFPTPLLDRLDQDEIDAVLAHELAHLRRRDHWVRMIELAATVLYWWHPLVWLARRNLRRAEERSCDAWVTFALPGSARAYATGLLETLTVLTSAPTNQPVAALPATATGMNTRDDLEERLTMIITERTPKLLSPFSRGAIAVLALAVLAVLPIRADREASTKEATHQQALKRLEAQRQELERSAHDLESQMEALEDQRLDLEDQAIALEYDTMRAEIEVQVDALQAEGDTASIEKISRQRERLENELVLRQRERTLERETRTRTRELTREAREHAQRAREFEARGAHGDARELADQARAIQRARAEVEHEHRQQAIALQKEAMAHRQQTRGHERDFAEAAGLMEEAREFERAMKIQQAQAESERMAIAKRFEQEAASVEAEMEASMAKAKVLEGRVEDDAAKHLAQVEALEREHEQYLRSVDRGSTDEQFAREIEEKIRALEAERENASGDVEAEIATQIEHLRSKLEALQAE